jgi:hypothetical protein
MNVPIGDRDEIEQLRRQLKEITAERDRLLEENRRLISCSEHSQECIPAGKSDSANTIIGISLDTAIRSVAILPKVNNESSLSEKVQLFRSVFRGREDVFAKLWQSKRNGKVGYSPACSHE